MLCHSRRAVLVLSALAGLGLAVSLGLAQVGLRRPPVLPMAPPPPGTPPAPANPTTEFSDNISLPTDPELQKKDPIGAALDYIKEQDWVTVTNHLQKLIDRPEDVFVRVTRKGADGKSTTAWASVKTEANRLIATLPPQGLDFYKLTFGPTAATMLKEAKENNNVEQLSQVMARFLYTDAGAEATNLLGTYYLDRGSYVTASLCFERLLNRSSPAKLTNITLYKAAYAFHLAGDKANEDRIWQELNRRGQNLVLGSERHSIEDLQGVITALARGFTDRNLNDWPLFGGTPSRNGKAEGGIPFIEAHWRKQTWEQKETKGWIDTAIHFANQRKLPLLPAAFPITATITREGKKVPLLVYRSHGGIYAVNVKTGELAWRSTSAWSLDTMVKTSQRTPAITSWVNHYNNTLSKPNLIFENTTIGTLSTDNNYVFAIEDLAVPPPPTLGMEFDRFNPGASTYQRYDQKVTEALRHNRLQAIELTTGKLKWELGGTGDKAGELADSYFLGPPLPIAGKLYALVEKNQDLRLVCIDALQGKLLSSQTLASTKDKMQVEPLRRMQAAHLAYGEGMLICPTNAGALLCIDQLTKSLVWAYPYRQKPEAAAHNQPEEMPANNFGRIRGRGIPQGFVMGPGGVPVPALSMVQYHWQVSAPIIQDGKVVFTAPDARAVHCINLRDCSRVWIHPRAEDDLFLGGVFNGKVVIVGKRNVRALSLAGGKQLWSLEVGLPSGQGIASDNIYYLPLKSAVQSSEPEICAIDLERGQVQAHTKSRKHEVPGNLIFYEGDVVSQTLTEVVAFPQLKVKLAQIDDLITKNPNDPIGLTERGELRLDKGDLQGAIDDLARAIKNTPPPEVRAKARVKLYETLTEFFQKDFNSAEKYLDVYEDLCKADLESAATDAEKQERLTESRRRRANFLCLVAKGKEGQRKLVEAFEKYLEFSALAGKDELISVIDEPSVRAAADVWSQGRIRAMIDSARPEERQPLEDRIAASWKEIQSASDLEKLRNFVNVFGSLFKVGKEARLQLAERLMEESDPQALLDAERQLYLLRSPTEEPALAARAVEALARLNTRKGLLKDAAYYYRLLRRDYGNVPVIDGKTGSDIFDEQATDKRLLPFMDEPDRLGSGGRPIKVSSEQGGFPFQNQTYQLGQVGEKLPYFQENQLVVRYTPHSLKVLDRASGEERGNVPLTATMFQTLAFGNGQSSSIKFPFFNLGHLVVLPLGNMVFGIDPINRKVLWEKNLSAGSLSSGPGPGLNQMVQLTVDPKDGSILVPYADGWVQRLGTTGPLQGNVICLQTRDGLIGLDPVTGRPLWTRSDVSSRSHIFGDEQILYVVEMNQDNKATSTRALRAYDGVSIRVSDFAAIYNKRVAQAGRTLAVTESNAEGMTLQLHDVSTGQEVWKGTFKAGALLLKSEEPELTGMVEPDGTVRVVNLRTHKEVLTSRLADPKHLLGAQQVWLLADHQDYYLAVNGQANAQVPGVGGVQSCLMPGTGLRAIPVNGMVYCFSGGSGKMRWYYPMEHQMLVLEQFRELPFVLFAARQYSQNGFALGRVGNANVAVRSIQKSNGKLIGILNSSSNPTFHALTVDARGGKVELIGSNLKIVHQLNGGPAGN